jgi:hypothetical protein
MPAPAIHAAYWTRLIAEWRSSGLTQAEFCRNRGLALYTFRDWLYKRLPNRAPRDRSQPRTAPPRFLPVRLVATTAGTPQPAHQPIEVLLDGGRRIAIAPDFDAETLRRVIAALEGPTC